MNADTLYTRLAGSYDVTLKLAGYPMAVSHFIRIIPFEPDQPIRILDAGCGTGFYSLALLKRYPSANVVAFDLNKKMIANLQRKVGKNGLAERIHIFRANMVKPLPVPDRDFDLIVTAGVLEYVQIEEAVRNLSGYMRPGGFWLNVPIKTNLFGQLIGKLYHLQPYSRDENIRVFERNGLRFVKKIDFLSLKEAHLFRKS